MSMRARANRSPPCMGGGRGVDAMLRLREFPDNAELAPVLADEIANTLRGALAARGKAALAVSGGSTPRPLFKALSMEDLDWSRVRITLVDERWVDETHPDSNAKLVRETLLQGKAAAADFIGLKTAAPSPFGAEREAAARLPGFETGIDVAVLGMGEDGHTASFFPGAAELPAALALPSSLEETMPLCVAVHPPAAPHDRMTLSLAALLRSWRVFLHIAGAAKRAVLETALDPAGDEREMPIRALIRPLTMLAHPDVETFYAANG